jgi:hypothetical protein
MCYGIYMDKYIIYGLIDPFIHQLRYIGKSTTGTQRCGEHLKKSSLNHHTHKDNWILSLLQRGKKPEIEILEVLSGPEFLNEAEKFNIAYFKSLGCNLTNHTEGGEGTFGYTHREETIKILSEKAKLRPKGPLPEGMKLAKEHVFVDG